MAIWINFGMQFWLPSWISQISDKQKKQKEEEEKRKKTSEAPMTPVPQQNQTQPRQVVQSQQTIPQKAMMSYNVTPKNPSQKFPWLEISEEEYINKSLDSLWLKWIQRKAMEEDAYRTFTEAKQARAFLDERANVRKNIFSWWTWLNKTQSNMLAKQSTFTDIIREEALSKWIKTVTQIDDATLLQRAFQQNPDSQKLFEDYVNDKITTTQLAETITWKSIDDDEMRQERESFKKENPWMAKFYTKSVWWNNLLKKMWNIVTGNVTEDDETWFQTRKQEKEKTFKDVALWDMWAVPSVIAWAISAPLNAWWTIIDLWGKLFWADINVNESIDKLIDKVWIQKDWRYNAWKIAGEIWTSVVAVWTLMNWISKVWQVANLISKYPKIAKYIAKPILEWLWYQWVVDLSKKELSSKWQYATSAVLSTVMTWLSWLWWLWKSALRDPKKYFQSAAKNVKSDFVKDITKKTDDFVINPKSENPLKVVQKKIDDVIEKVASDKWVVWEQLWKMRTQMKTITHSTDDIVETINKSLNENDIALKITKTSKWYKASWSLLKTEWKWWIIKDIVAELNALKNIWAKDKLRWLDKVNQEIIAFMKKSNIDSSLKNSLGKMSNQFTKTIDDIMTQYWFTKWEYWKLATTQKIAKELASEAWEKWVNRLKKVFWPEWGADYKKFLEELKELWYTTDDLLSETIVTNYIMASKLGKDMFTQAVDQFYPSIPWLYELWIKTVKWAVVNPSKELLRYTKDYAPWIKKTITDSIWKSVKPTLIREKDKLGF